LKHNLHSHFRRFDDERVNQYFKNSTKRFAIYFMYITGYNSLSLKYDTTYKKIYFINELNERGEYILNIKPLNLHFRLVLIS
jgi:hypothetical protein